MISEMYDALVESLYNIQVSLDPEMVIIGGGVSARNEFINELHKRLYNNLAKDDIESIMPEIQACQYHNDANLIGAALNFETLKQKKKRRYLELSKKDNHYMIDTQQLAQEHDRQIIEASFADFETVCTLSEEEMKQEFGKYGWGE